MFYISLPFFYENYQFNQFFKQYINNNNQFRENKLIAKFNIEYTYGAFPWSYWNGDINNHSGIAILASDMKPIIDQSFTPIRINASNIYVKDTDYYDIHENSILRIVNGNNVAYEISDINLMQYISKSNLNNKFILSNNAQLLYDFNIDTLNIFQKYSEIELINIGYKLNENIDYTQLKHKLEISIGHCQNCPQERNFQCITNEQKNIYNYSKVSLFMNCPFEYKPVNYYEEIQPYLKQNIKHFKIVTNSKNLKEFNINIIKSFVKPEYQGDCINEYYKWIERKQ